MNEHGLPYVKEIVLFLASAGLIVPFARRFGINQVLGFLVVGMLIGPHGFGRLADQLPLLSFVTVADPDSFSLLAELGIVFLLFTIGLELSLDRLWSLRRYLAGFGLSQIVLTAAVVGAIAAWYGNDVFAALLLGVAFAVSSTAIVLQLLIQRRQTGTILGRAGLGVLLMQDLAVVPILALVTVASAGAADSDRTTVLLLAMAKGIAATLLIIFAGRVIIRPAFRWVGAQRSPDVFMAATLLVVFVTSVLTAAAGLSLALGAFLAGLLLSETEYRHEVAVDIEPFRGLLLGLFFMSVGMDLDIIAALGQPVTIIGSVIGLYMIKGVLVTGLGKLFGLPTATAVESGFLLGQAGEFAFLIVGLSITGGLLDASTGQFALLVTGLSMLFASPVAHLGQIVGERIAAKDAPGALPEIEAQEGHVIVAGYGRVGRTFARLLDGEAIPYIVFDSNAVTVATARAGNKPVYFGDASRVDILRHAGPDQAQAVVITVDDPLAADRIVRAVKREWPHLPVFARARDTDGARALLTAGASEVVPEISESCLQLAGRVLLALGTPEDAVTQRLAQEREAELALYRRQS